MPDPSSTPIAEAHPWLRQAWEAVLAIGGTLLAVLAAVKRSRIIEAIKVLFGANGGDGGGGKAGGGAPAAGGDHHSASVLGELKALQEQAADERATDRLLMSFERILERVADRNIKVYTEAMVPLLAAMTRLSERFEAASAAREAEVVNLRKLVASLRSLLTEFRSDRREITRRVDQIQKLAETLSSIFQEMGRLPDFPTTTETRPGRAREGE